MRITTLNPDRHLADPIRNVTDRAGLPPVLQSAMADLEVSNQNVTASDSQVTGTEMSPAMAAFTRNQILLHAGSTTPAEADAPQAILERLQ